MKQVELTEGIDFYLNADGHIVFTEKYHLDRGFCCGMGCLHCPYQNKNVPEPTHSHLPVQKNDTLVDGTS